MPLHDLQAVAIAALVLLLVYWLRFRERLPHIPGPPSASWLTGNLTQLFNENAWSFHAYLNKTFSGVVRVHTMFNAEDLLVFDSLTLHYIVIKELDNYDESDSTISKQRKMLKPLFSMRKMRDILPLIYPVAQDMRNGIAQQLKNGPEVIDLMRWFSRAALEYIGRGGLGHSFGPLDDKDASAYSDMISRLGHLFLRTTLLRNILPYVIDIGSPSFQRQALRYLPSPAVREMADIVDTLNQKSADIIKSRKAALAAMGEDDSEAKDVSILGTLLKANLDTSKEDRVPDEEVLGQVSMFIFAGEDTTSHLLCRMLHQLAKHPARQKTLDLPYLDAICRETLRVFPPLTHLPRVARQDTILPLAWPITATDRKTQIKEIAIKKGQSLMVSIIGANHSTRIWGEDAEEWKPERWLQSEAPFVEDARLPGVYSSMMTFLGGSRACMGFKFAEMEMKLVLSTIVEAFAFAEGPPITWEMSSIVRPTVTGQRTTNAQLPLKVSLAPTTNN
ncbi:cytochrome P450 [Laetiporus sulphureus 93-53]|uniref:Cytochrome P450 n=1 Tax=Laetiporus sulphureus 93-53 TaxID=1314785 RepID=A0A165C5J4_9APHY|nr:cytochrome P450 [Laetiporus sulphureus 93-53]KZT02243.1 cytochrome P450 [Laetiporus sulphureus 93-53]